MKYIKYIVSGRVQGVGFRQHVYLKALSINAKGWVKNLPNRQVEVLIDEETSMNIPMIKMILDGPPLARVAYIDTEEIELPELEGFSIR